MQSPKCFLLILCLADNLPPWVDNKVIFGFSSQCLAVSKCILYALAIPSLSFLLTTLLQFLSIFQPHQMISGVILANMKTLRYRPRRQRLYVLPGHCAILTQLYALKVYVHAPMPLQSLNRRSLAGPLNVITGSSEPLTDTCWRPGMTRAPKKISLPLSHISESETGDPVSHHLHYIPRCVTAPHEGKPFEDKWSSILLLLVSPII